jgi:hypothetical protein
MKVEDYHEDLVELDYNLDRREFTLTDLCKITGLASQTVEKHLRSGHFGRKYTRLDPLPNGEKRYILKPGAIDYFREKRWRIQDTGERKATQVNIEERDTTHHFYVLEYTKKQASRIARKYAKEKIQDLLDAADNFGREYTKAELKKRYLDTYWPYYQSVLPNIREVKKERRQEWEIINDIDIPFNLLGDIAGHYSDEERHYFMREYIDFVETYNTDDPIQRFTIISMIDEQLRQQRLRKRLLGLADYVDEEMERSLTASVNRWKILNEKLEKRVASEKPKTEEVEKKEEFKIGGGMA